MAEIAVCRGFDSIGAGAEVDAVQIKFEDLILRIFVLEPKRENGFLDFAREGAFLGEEQILGKLLRESRAALHAAAARHVARQRAQDAKRIQAPMRVEAAI